MKIEPTGIIDIDGQQHMRDAQDRLVPVSTVKPQDKLQDEMVRKILGYAHELSCQVARFKAHTFEDIGDFLALLKQEYDQTRGGKYGNMTFMSFDGCLKVQVQVAEHVEFGPELQIAKGLVDECLTEWSDGARDELRAVITRAFNTDKEGEINRSEIFMLLRLEIADERWKRAMEAIRDAMRVVGSKTYVRCYARETSEAPWTAITIDLAKA